MRSDRLRTPVLHASAPRAAFVAALRVPTYSQEDLDAAYARGFLAGTEDAGAEQRRASLLLAERVVEARDSTAAELRRIDAARREDIVEFAFEVARWLVQDEIRTDPTRILGRLEAALPDRRDDVVVRVAPQLVDAVQSAVPGLKVTGDPELGLGDVIIVAPDAQLDGTLDDALARLRLFLEADDDGTVR